MTGRNYVSGVILLCAGSATLGAYLGALGIAVAVAAVIVFAILEHR